MTENVAVVFFFRVRPGNQLAVHPGQRSKQSHIAQYRDGIVCSRNGGHCAVPVCLLAPSISPNGEISCLSAKPRNRWGLDGIGPHRFRLVNVLLRRRELDLASAESFLIGQARNQRLAVCGGRSDMPRPVYVCVDDVFRGFLLRRTIVAIYPVSFPDGVELPA